MRSWTARAGASRSRPALALPSSLPEEDALKAPRWVEKALGREQTHILVGGLWARGSRPRTASRSGLLQTLLGGQSGRLFIELREKKSLAYTVAPMSFEGIERGYVGTYIACAPQKGRSDRRHQQCAREARRQRADPAEMNRAKEFFLGRRAMDMQSDSAIAAGFGLEHLYGVEHLSDEALIKKIGSITAKDLQRVCSRYLVEPFMVTSVVG